MISLVTKIRLLLLKNLTSGQVIIKNTFWLILSQGAESIVSFLVIVWLARHFGPEQYGQWAFAFGFVFFFSAVANFELSTLAIREVARNKAKSSEYIDNVLAIKIVLGVIVFLAIFLFSKFLGLRNSDQFLLMYLLALYMIASTFASFFQSIFRAYEKMQYETICRAIQWISLLCFVAIVIFSGKPIFYAGYAYLGSALIGITVSFFFVWHYFSKFFLTVRFAAIKEIIRQAWPMSLSSLSVAAYYYLASVFLGIAKSNEEVSLYNLAFKTSFLVVPFSTILFSSFFPQISRLFKEDKDKLKRLCLKYVNINLIISVPILVGGIITAPKIINFLYGLAYRAAVDPFRILVLSSAVAFLTSAFVGCLLSFDKQKSVLKSTLLGAILNVLANIVLIPKYGAVGAAASAFIATLLISIVSYIILIKAIGPVILTRHLFNSLASSLVMASALIALLRLGLGAVYIVALGVLIYFASFYIIEGKNGLLSIKWLKIT